MYKIAIIGAKDSGKTTLVEKLIKLLSKQAISVMSIKHSAHNHKFDVSGKDSDRHRQAGSKLTLAINPNEFAIYSENDTIILSDLESAYSKLFDICIVEGDKFSDIPKILLTRNIENIDTENITDVQATYGNIDINFVNNHFFKDDIPQLSDEILRQLSEHSAIRRTV